MYVVGIDGGATKTEFVLMKGNEVVTGRQV